MNIAFAIGSTRGIDHTWTTLHLAHQALVEGHRVSFFLTADLEVTSTGRLVARSWVAPEDIPTREALASLLAAQELPRRYLDLPSCDLLFLRFNPPNFTALAFAQAAKAGGTLVVNDPLGIVTTRSKAWLASLQGITRPPTVITRSLGTARLFAQNLDTPIIVKPIQGSGGQGVCYVQRGDTVGLDHALEHSSALGDGHVVVQQYLPEASEGEKRLFWVCGEIMGAYIRKRAPGEFRHNLKQGSIPRPCTITSGDQKLGQEISPHLTSNGILIAGLDVIGDHLVEVNTLNPGGLHHATNRCGSDLASRVLSKLKPCLSKPVTGLNRHEREKEL